MERINVSLSDDVADRLQTASEKCGISRPTLIRLVITYWLKGQFFQEPLENERMEDAA